jgi:hypothetical protein
MKKVLVILVAILMFSAAITMALEYGTTTLKGRTSKLAKFEVSHDIGADTSATINCASFSAMTVMLKAHGTGWNTAGQTDSNNVSIVFQFSNLADPGVGDFTMYQGVGATYPDSLSVTAADSNWVMKAITIPPARWMRAIIRPMAANKIDSAGAFAYANIFWIRDMPVR